MEAVKKQLRSGLTWAPQNNANWCQSEHIADVDEVVGFKPCIAAARKPAPAPVPARDAFREILEKFQD